MGDGFIVCKPSLLRIINKIQCGSHIFPIKGHL